MSAARAGGGGVRAALGRPRLWRVTAALAALLLCGLLLLSAQGSLRIIGTPPTRATTSPRWLRWCYGGEPREDRTRLAFCARVEGRVLGSTHGPERGESHVALIADFHLVIVRLPEYARTPGLGARVTAIGPLFRARDGEREVQAFSLRGA